MKIITLLENNACRPGLSPARGLSVYVETKRHKILFDMGPDASFLANARLLGVDISAVDIAVLAHGPSDHGGGLTAFCEVNDRAKIYLRREALGAYYAVLPGREPNYIGLPHGLEKLSERFVFAENCQELSRGLRLFSDVEDDKSLRAVAAKLQEKTEAGFLPDGFAHEQHLLAEEDGKAVLLVGCGHLGILNTLRAAKRHLGRMPDAVFGGFHLFELEPESPEANALISATGKALLEGSTVYYTGHCTGEWAYDRLHEILGDRLRTMNGGTAAVL